jgi:hypothetical protein
MTHYEAETIKLTESDLVLKNDSGLVIKTLATFWGYAELCTKIADVMNALPEVVEALEAIKANEADAARKAEKALAKLREAS